MDQFEFYKSKINVTGTADIITKYILLTCRFFAQSVVQKQRLLDFSFHLETGALVSGHKKINVSMMYNPVTKQMDPMVCQFIPQAII
ncbi:MAG: hypothetical protein H8D87_21985 [Deltaproteobacteria bacterium]|nr:hypothetical protein [Candidatus Desulfobacula maris]